MTQPSIKHSTTIELNLASGPGLVSFLYQLNAALRHQMEQSRGRAQVLPNGDFESVAEGALNIGETKVTLAWKYIQSIEKTLKSIEVSYVGTEATQTDWIGEVNKLVLAALAKSLSSEKRTFFRRAIFNYVGPRMEGEYWFGKTLRFAPAWPEDPAPNMLQTERVVVIDQIVEALDEHEANLISVQASNQAAANFSFLLNVGLYKPLQRQAWVVPMSEDGLISKSERFHLGFHGLVTAPNKMPRKAELCPLGEWRSSLKEDHLIAGNLVSLPRAARKLLAKIKTSSTSVKSSFENSMRLFQISRTVEYPSVALAYHVAAVEALSKVDTVSTASFGEFIRKYGRSSLAFNDEIIQFLYGSARSAHFHAGQFPAGEFARPDFPDVFIDVEYVMKNTLIRRGYDLMRDSILGWMETMTSLHPQESEPETSLDNS